MSLANILTWKLGGAMCAAAKLRVDGDEQGNETIAMWDAAASGRAKPTDQEIAAWTAEFDAIKDDVHAADNLAANRFARVLAKVLRDQENRIRALEGGQSISAAAYKAALVTIWKNTP